MNNIKIFILKSQLDQECVSKKLIRVLEIESNKFTTIIQNTKIY